MKNISAVVIEDEEDILELISYNLRREGFSVNGATSGEAGLNLVESTTPNIVLLDLMLPGVDGLEVCKRLKANSKLQSIPVLMISAKGEESDIVAGLELGADDYVTKPFSPKILIARVRAVLRRFGGSKPDSKGKIAVHDLVADPVRFRASLADQPLNLTRDEFHLLCFLARHPGWVFTRYQIVNGVKGDNYVVTERAVDVRIAGLRKKLGRYSDYVETVRGVGYRFKEA
ncbi:MAG: response regulator [Gammaproteobacteria bacterium]|nr:response regulator [Gammaproteobacteria bacterium]